MAEIEQRSQHDSATATDVQNFRSGWQVTDERLDSHLRAEPHSKLNQRFKFGGRLAVVLGGIERLNSFGTWHWEQRTESATLALDQFFGNAFD